MAEPVANVAGCSEAIIIAAAGDLVLQISKYESEEKIHPNSTDDTTTPSRVVSFRVEKKVLIKHSNYFRAMFAANRWAEGDKDVVSLNEDTPTSIEIWLRLLHSVPLTTAHYAVPISEIWHMIMVSEKYDLERKIMKDGFLVPWCKHNMDKVMEETDSMRKMLFPLYTLDMADVFMRVTKHLVYNYRGHITELNPTKITQMHLPQRIIQQLNAAKGRLKTILHRELFTDAKTLLDSDGCTHTEKVFFEYFHELYRIKVWPMEDHFKDASVRAFLDRLDRFDDSSIETYLKSSENGLNNDGDTKNKGTNDDGDDCSYGPCRRNWGITVAGAQDKVLGYFDGLCLVCMDHTKSIKLKGDIDQDYWFHAQWAGSRRTVCGKRHGEPSWYFSFMGRREPRGQFEKIQRPRPGTFA